MKLATALSLAALATAALASPRVMLVDCDGGGDEPAAAQPIVVAAEAPPSPPPKTTAPPPPSTKRPAPAPKSDEKDQKTVKKPSTPAPPPPSANGAACTPDPSGETKDLGDGTFFDAKTCLTWMSKEWANSGGLIGRAHVVSCADADVGGHSDWRGADVGEMASLIVDRSDCGSWAGTPRWSPMLDISGFNAPVMFWTAGEGDGQGSEHACAVNGNTGKLEGNSRMNPYHVVCVRGESPLTGTRTECTGNACD